ncbi:Ig-like domain-containing protein, partial [Cohnella suwonensis]
MQKQWKRVTSLLLAFLIAANVILGLPAGWGGQAYASSSDIITTVAGTGTGGYSGDGGAATLAELDGPSGMAVDSSGNLYIADSNNNIIRKVAKDGTISTVAGTGVQGYFGDGGPATSAQFYSPSGVAVDSSDNLYIADTNNFRIRKVATDGTISTVAGTGVWGNSGDGGLATLAKFYSPSGVAVDSSDNLYIADSSDNRIRKVATDGTINTVAGNGSNGYSGEGPATLVKLNNPRGIAVDSIGNLYIADYQSNRIRKVTGGTISTVAGTGSVAYSGDEGMAISTNMAYPTGVAVDSSDNLYIADFQNSVIWKVMVTDGTISKVAGIGGTSGYSGDGGAATLAKLQNPRGVAVDSSGNVYIADSSDRIRKMGKYTVTFNSNGGSAVSSQSMSYDGTGTATEPTDPTRAGYSFGGWYKDSGLTAQFNFTEFITGDKTLYAKWTAVPVTGVTLDAGTLTLTAGGSTAALTETVSPSNALNKNVTWTSSNPSVATVSSSGVVTPVAAGTATITVTTTDGSKTATSAVTVSAATVPVTGVALDQSTLSLTVGGTVGTLAETVSPSNATDKSVTWSSSNPLVATVSSSGVVTPVAAGTATITVTTTDGNKTATSAVTVSAATVPVTGVALDKSTLSLTVGGTVGTLAETVSPSNATDKSVTWSSSNTLVATVSSSGVVTPVAAGKATITVTTTDGSKTATSEVTVSAATVPVTGVALDKSTLALTVGGTVGTLAETVSPSNATDKSVTWSSSNTLVATVSSSGVVTPVAAGTATITVTTTDGSKTATSAVTVSAATVPGAPPTPDTSNTPNTGVDVLVNGKAESAGTATTTKVNEQSVTTVAVDSKKLEDKLAAEGEHAVITIPVNTKSDVVIGELDGQMVKNMEQKQAVVEIKTENATYTLPAQQINISAISDQLGKSIQLQDIKVKIEISKPTADTVKIVENSAAKGELTLVVPPLNFTVKANYGDTTIDVSK